MGREAFMARISSRHWSHWCQPRRRSVFASLNGVEPRQPTVSHSPSNRLSMTSVALEKYVLRKRQPTYVLSKKNYLLRLGVASKRAENRPAEFVFI